MEKDREKAATGGRNVSVWFPDADDADRLVRLAEELKTSVSAILVELAVKSMPAIERGKTRREIGLDGVRIVV